MSLSVSMIVRDEARMLPGALESLRTELGDVEIVVCDTGSTDGTLAVAHAFGTRVVHFAWCDDFAAARNFAIAQCSGDWVLVFDADQRLAAGSGTKIQHAAEANGADAFMLWVHNADAENAPFEAVLKGTRRVGSPCLVVHMLRRADGPWYEGAVHETAIPWVEQRGKPMGRIEGGCAIVHLGSTADARLSAQKAARNIRILQQRIAKDAHDVEAYSYLAFEHLLASDYRAAREVAMTGWNAFRSNRQKRCRGLHRLVTALGYSLLDHGEAAWLLETLDVVQRNEVHPDYDYLRGLACAQIGARQGAIEAFNACLAHSDGIYVQRFFPTAVEACRERLALSA